MSENIDRYFPFNNPNRALALLIVHQVHANLPDGNGFRQQMKAKGGEADEFQGRTEDENAFHRARTIPAYNDGRKDTAPCWAGNNPNRIEQRVPHGDAIGARTRTAKAHAAAQDKRCRVAAISLIEAMSVQLRPPLEIVKAA
jgi:hypothetical protein